MNEQAELLETIKGCGLNLMQSKVYLNLLNLGPSTAGPLVRKIGAHRQLVYSALDFLESQGLVSHTIKNNRKVFNPARPETLLEKESMRVHKLKLAMPKLQNLMSQGSSKLDVDVLKGKHDFIRRLFTLVDSAAKSDGIIRILADVRDVDVYAVIGDFYEEYKKYQKAKKVKKRLIAPESSITKEYHEKFVKEIGSVLRISKSAISIPTAICFTKELVVFDIFSEDVVSLMIWNKTIAESFKSHFESLWKSAVPYKKYSKEGSS